MAAQACQIGGIGDCILMLILDLRGRLRLLAFRENF